MALLSMNIRCNHCCHRVGLVRTAGSGSSFLKNIVPLFRPLIKTVLLLKGLFQAFSFWGLF